MKNLLLLIAIAITLTACGGGSNSNESISPEKPKYIYGNTIDDPTEIVEGVQHLIGLDPESNHFKVDLNEGDIVYLHAVLDTPIDDTMLSRCSALKNYPIWIGLKGSCDEVMYDVKTEDSGEYLIKFDLANNSGYFEIIIIKESGKQVESSKGTVTNPVKVELGVQYAINKNDFYNFFSLETGSIVYIYPSGSIKPSDHSRCIAAGGNTTSPDVFGVSIDGQPYSCNAGFEVLTSATDFHIRLNDNVTGYFIVY